MEAPEVMVIQFAVVPAVHPQAAPVDTVTFPVPAVEATDTVAGVTVYAHPAVAACVIVTVCPATVSVPVRTLPVGLTATV
jgi:hypothetical protein